MNEEYDIDIPGEEDENIGEGVPKKKEKKRKTKEEKIAQRKVIFWTLLGVILITITFWLVPLIKKGGVLLPRFEIGVPEVSLPKVEWKGYVEYDL